MSTNSLGSLNLGRVAYAPKGGAQSASGLFRSDAFPPTEGGTELLRGSALAAEWDALCRRVAAPPFLRPQWTCAWWRAFAETDDKLVLWYLRREGRVVALLPLVQRGDTLCPALNYHTPQSGLLAEDDASAEALVCALLLTGHASHTMLAGLDVFGADPDICRRAARSAGHSIVVAPHERACFLTLEAGWDVYETRLGRDTRGDVRRRRRRLQEYGAVSFSVHTGCDQLARLLDAAFMLESSGWKLRDGTAIRSDARVERFYEEVARWTAIDGMLRLCFLRIDGMPVAMQLNLEHHGTWYLLKCGYDERYAHASPGKVLQYDCIRHCFAAGMARIEFCGDRDPHKVRWSPQCRPLQRVHFFPQTLRGQFARLRVVARPWFKTVYRHYDGCRLRHGVPLQ